MHDFSGKATTATINYDHVQSQSCVPQPAVKVTRALTCAGDQYQNVSSPLVSSELCLAPSVVSSPKNQ